MGALAEHGAGSGRRHVQAGASRGRGGRQASPDTILAPWGGAHPLRNEVLTASGARTDGGGVASAVAAGVVAAGVPDDAAAAGGDSRRPTTVSRDFRASSI